MGLQVNFCNQSATHPDLDRRRIFDRLLGSQILAGPPWISQTATAHEAWVSQVFGIFMATVHLSAVDHPQGGPATTWGITSDIWGCFETRQIPGVCPVVLEGLGKDPRVLAAPVDLLSAAQESRRAAVAASKKGSERGRQLAGGLTFTYPALVSTFIDIHDCAVCFSNVQRLS